jgi:hypothetical protein
MAKQRTRFQKTLIWVLVSWLVLLLATFVPWIILANIQCAECSFGWGVVALTALLVPLDLIALFVGAVLLIVAAVRQKKA